MVSYCSAIKLTTIPVQSKNYIYPKFYYAKCLQQANGNDMSAQHYSTEYREGGKCVYPLVALSIFYTSERQQERLCIILITKIFASTKISGINTIFPIGMC